MNTITEQSLFQDSLQKKEIVPLEKSQSVLSYDTRIMLSTLETKSRDRKNLKPNSFLLRKKVA